MADRLYRTTDDRFLAGVAGGIARALDADPSIIRVAWVIVTILSGGLALVVYVVMAVVVPEAPPGMAWSGGPSSADGPVDATSSPVPAAGWTGGATGPAAPIRRARSGDGGRQAGLVIGVLLVGLGAVFLVREVMPAIDLSAVWPALSVAFGVLLIVLSIRPRRAS